MSGESFPFVLRTGNTGRCVASILYACGTNVVAFPVFVCATAKTLLCQTMRPKMRHEKTVWTGEKSRPCLKNPTLPEPTCAGSYAYCWWVTKAIFMSLVFFLPKTMFPKKPPSPLSRTKQGNSIRGEAHKFSFLTVSFFVDVFAVTF